MKVLQVFPGFTTGGPSYTVPMMCRALKKSGVDTELHFLDSIPDEIQDLKYQNYELSDWPFLAQWGYSHSLFKGLKKACKTAQIIQTNSLWQYPNLITEFARRGSECKSVIVPRGTLSKYSLSISPWKKKIVLTIGQQVALKNCDLFIATCEDEYKDIRSFGLNAPVAIIPNGIDIPSFKSKIKKEKRVVFLSRIHKKKGIDILIKAWSVLEPQFPDWDLVIVGPQNDYANQMKALALNLRLKNIDFKDAIYGQDKFEYLRNSELFVLPTHSENWGIAILEALACSIPAICTTGAPWEGLITKKCGDWIDLTENNLIDSMQRLMFLSSSERNEMGNRGYEWISQDFSWDAIGQKTLLAYKWLCGELKDKPEFILTE